jgi:hypothetical protein
MGSDRLSSPLQVMADVPRERIATCPNELQLAADVDGTLQPAGSVALVVIGVQQLGPVDDTQAVTRAALAETVHGTVKLDVTFDGSGLDSPDTVDKARSLPEVQREFQESPVLAHPDCCAPFILGRPQTNAAAHRVKAAGRS